MTPVSGLLEELGRLGIHAIADGGDLVLRGDVGRIPAELRDRLKESKPSLLAELRLRCVCSPSTPCEAHRHGASPATSRPGPADTVAERDRRIDRLLGELREAQSWLDTAERKLGDLPQADLRLAQRFVIVMTEWQIRETLLRQYGYTGCIHKLGHCPADAVESCFTCRQDTEAAAEHRTSDRGAAA